MPKKIVFYVYRRHQDRVKKFVTEPGNPYMIVSCGEDGLGEHFFDSPRHILYILILYVLQACVKDVR